MCTVQLERKLWKDKEMVRKQCELKRSIPNLFQFIVQVSLSQFPRTPTTGASIIFAIFVLIFAFGITVSWLELTLLRSHFKCLSSSQEQSSSSLDNNLNSLTPGTIDQKSKRLQHALGYVVSFRQISQKSSQLEQQMKNLDSRETVLPRRWGIETWIFGPSFLNPLQYKYTML